MRSAIVLAGGISKRFGADKAMLRVRGKPMVSLVIEACIAASADDVIVVVSTEGQRERLSEVLPREVTVVMDDVDRHQGARGPLLGVATGLAYAKADYSFVAGCDVPLIRARLIDYLFKRAARGVDAVIPRWPNGYVEPLHAVYRVGSTLRAAEDAIRQGRQDLRSVARLLGRVDYVPTDELKRLDEGLVSFINVNTQDDLAELLEVYGCPL